MDTHRIQSDMAAGYIPRYNLSENGKIQFGKYKRKALIDIARDTPDYIEWLIDQNCISRRYKLELVEVYKQAYFERTGKEIGYWKFIKQLRGCTTDIDRCRCRKCIKPIV